MEALTKNQIIKKTYCSFHVWTPTINALNVTKKALKAALKSGVFYSVESTECGTTRSGRVFMAYVIMIY